MYVCWLFQLVFLHRNKKGVTTLNILNPEDEGIGAYTQAKEITCFYQTGGWC